MGQLAYFDDEAHTYMVLTYDGVLVRVLLRDITSSHGLPRWDPIVASSRRSDPRPVADSRIARMRLRSTFIVLLLALLAAACGGSNSGGSGLTLNTGPAPWPNPDNVADRIEAAGLPSSSTESLTVHYHSHVDIFVDGKSEPVASSIGREDQSLFSPLHTHATSGLIHIEAPEEEDFTVGMLFTEWGVRLTNDCIGGYCSPDTKRKAYVDGASYAQPISTSS